MDKKMSSISGRDTFSFLLFFTNLYVYLRYISDASVLFGILFSLAIAYLPSYMDGSEFTAEGRLWSSFSRGWLWTWFFHSYFPSVRIEYEVPLDQHEQCIVASHPHGVSSLHHIFYMTNALGFLDSFTDNKRHVGANILFKIPVLREISLWLGLVASNRYVVKRVLDSGKSLVLLPGGMNEQIISQEGQHTLYIRDRKGFVKLAIEYGVSVTT